MCILEVENQEQTRSEFFCGSIKSFNTRRGFGFVSCEETALRFGRDVYLSKDEAMILAAEPGVGLAAANAARPAASEPQSKVPPVQEGDFLLFQVMLSTEGFPQAFEARKIRRLRGIVQHAPSSTSDGIIIVNGDCIDESDVKEDAALQQLLGAVVRLRQAECGQLQLRPNDQVVFCCVGTTGAQGQALEAQLVELLCSSQAPGSVLGCFSLKLPFFPNVELHGYALTDRVVLSNVPSDLAASDLMRLFCKLGGKEATMTPGGASIAFSEPENVAKFLAQATHTISENGITQLAHVGPCPHRQSGSSQCMCGSIATPEAVKSAATPQRMSLSDTIAHNVQPQFAEPALPTQHEAYVQSACSSLHMPDANACCTIPIMANTATVPSWRCMHNNIVIPSAEPQMLVAGDASCSVCIQWPTVIHASAYVVELLDQATMIAQRYMRVPEGPLPALMDLRVEGLQPSAYAACVRCVAPCGCESTSSAWSFLPAGSMPSLQGLPPNQPACMPANLLQPHCCPPPPSAPPSLPSAMTMPPTSLPAIPEESSDVAAEILCLD